MSTALPNAVHPRRHVPARAAGPWTPHLDSLACIKCAYLMQAGADDRRIRVLELVDKFQRSVRVCVARSLSLGIHFVGPLMFRLKFWGLKVKLSTGTPHPTLPLPRPLSLVPAAVGLISLLNDEDRTDGTVPVDAQDVPRHRSPIQSILVAGNERSLLVAESLRALGFDVRAIRKPTVAEGTERLRITIHAYNTNKEVRRRMGREDRISKGTGGAPQCAQLFRRSWRRGYTPVFTCPLLY